MSDGAGRDLARELAFEQEKNRVLLEQVVSLEEEVANRVLAQFDGAISDETRDFWKQQVLVNRGAAEKALKEMANVQRAKDDGGAGKPQPLHNRSGARQGKPDGQSEHGASDSVAAKIRNRAQEISKNESVPFSVAFRRAEKELQGD